MQHKICNDFYDFVGMQVAFYGIEMEKKLSKKILQKTGNPMKFQKI